MKTRIEELMATLEKLTVVALLIIEDPRFPRSMATFLVIDRGNPGS